MPTLNYRSEGLDRTLAANALYGKLLVLFRNGSGVTIQVGDVVSVQPGAVVDGHMFNVAPVPVSVNRPDLIVGASIDQILPGQIGLVQVGGSQDGVNMSATAVIGDVVTVDPAGVVGQITGTADISVNTPGLILRPAALESTVFWYNRMGFLP